MRRLLPALCLLLAGTSAALAASGQRGVVASEHRLASEAGIAILRQGGNAVDAAVATALAIGVVNPSSSGLGGGGFMLVFDRRSRRVSALDYRETAPRRAARDMFVRDGEVVSALSLSSGLAVGVPGEVAGLFAALRRHGSLPFETVAAPAIRYAREGFAIEAHLAHAIEEQQAMLRSRPELGTLFLRPDGTLPEPGEILRREDLAATLETIAARGEEAFYGGDIANAIVESVRSNGGVMDRADLAGYRPIWRRPLRTRFRGHEVYSMPPPSSGGGVLIEILNVIRHDDLAVLGHNSPSYLHLVAEAMQLAFADRAAHYGDPDFVDVPLGLLLSPVRAAQLRRRISAATTFSSSYYGRSAADRDAGTSHLSVIDADGNAVACTTTINTTFGARLMAGRTGILLNNEMDDFSAQPGVPNVYGLVGSEANAIAPGKRPLSSMTPTLVLQDGEIALVAGASGGPRIISATLQVLLNSIVFDFGPEESVGAARIHHQWIPEVLMVESGVPVPVRSALRRMGHRLSESSALGAVQLARRAPGGLLQGAADPRKGGEAAAW